MISTLLRVQWLQLKRDRPALISVFFLPIAFFSVTMLIFGGMADPSARAKTIDLAVSDGDASDGSAALVEQLRDHAGEAIRVRTAHGPRAAVEAEVRDGETPVALIIGAGFSEALATRRLDRLPLTIVYDGANPVARYIANAAVQSAVLRQLLSASGEPLPSPAPGAPRGASPWDLVAVPLVDVRRDRGGPTLYYAAGIAVMFLLFSATRAGGALLEERDDGTLERVLNTRTGMRTLLAAKWIFFTLLGIAQIAAMFTWAALVFGAELGAANQLTGLAAMTIVTAAAAAAFGIVLATLFRTRAQLFGISTVIILIMSALGGSMAPRFMMPPFMDTVALFTFNGWALDGYLKVLWHAAPGSSIGATLGSVTPELAALALFGALLLLVADRLSRRWEVS